MSYSSASEDDGGRAIAVPEGLRSLLNDISREVRTHLIYRKVASSSTPWLVALLGYYHPQMVKSLNSSTFWLVAVPEGLRSLLIDISPEVRTHFEI